jgi:hypothetical protein
MRAFALLLIVPLAGCASATPGYTPEGPTRNVPPQLRPFNGGTVDKGGTYVVTAEERALSCQKLTGSMQVIMSRLKDSANRPRPSTSTTTMQTLSKPFSGGGANLDVDVEIQQSRARLKAYNELLAEKKCKTLDISGV